MQGKRGVGSRLWPSKVWRRGRKLGEDCSMADWSRRKEVGSMNTGVEVIIVGLWSAYSSA